jgi:hypothetical protein
MQQALQRLDAEAEKRMVWNRFSPTFHFPLSTFHFSDSPPLILHAAQLGWFGRSFVVSRRRCHWRCRWLGRSFVLPTVLLLMAGSLVCSRLPLHSSWWRHS